MTSVLSHDRAGPRGGTPVLLLHAGIADRRMWDPQWEPLTAERDVVRVDLRGFGESAERPEGDLSHVDDVIALLDGLEVDRCHVVGASLGAGVAVELALSRPELVESLLLAAPGGSLIADLTPDLRSFIEEERAALAADDLDGAVEADLRWWVDGPDRGPGQVDAVVREHVGRMQRRAFELTLDWDDVDEADLEPPALERLGDLRLPVLVVQGDRDLDAIRQAAGHLAREVDGARLVEWAGVAHLPSMERQEDFLALVQGWLAR